MPAYPTRMERTEPSGSELALEGSDAVPQVLVFRFHALD